MRYTWPRRSSSSSSSTVSPWMSYSRGKGGTYLYMDVLRSFPLPCIDIPPGRPTQTVFADYIYRYFIDLLRGYSSSSISISLPIHGYHIFMDTCLRANLGAAGGGGHQCIWGGQHCGGAAPPPAGEPPLAPAALPAAAPWRSRTTRSSSSSTTTTRSEKEMGGPANGSVELRPMMIAILRPKISSAHQGVALRKHKGMGGVRHTEALSYGQ
jgi:hypothetical protein